MIRVALTVLLPLLAPTAIYFLWLYAVAGKEARSPRALPWTWLIVVGMAAAGAALVIVGIDTGERGGGLYVPPHVSDGRVVPGQVAPGQVAPAPAPAQGSR